MNHLRGWLNVLAPFLRCSCHSQDYCPCWPNNFVGKFRQNPRVASKGRGIRDEYGHDDYWPQRGSRAGERGRSACVLP